MDIRYRLDKDISVDELIELYKAVGYNHWWTERNVRAMLAHCYLIVTAWAGDELVGTARVVSDGVNFALIDDVIVHPSFRRKGIGTALMQKVLEKIKPLKLDFVQLHPIPGREAFFKKLGFRVIRDSRVMELPR